MENERTDFDRLAMQDAPSKAPFALLIYFPNLGLTLLSRRTFQKGTFSCHNPYRRGIQRQSETMGSAVQQAAGAIQSEARGTSSQLPSQPAINQQPWRRRPWLWLGALALLCAAIGGFAWIHSGGLQPSLTLQITDLGSDIRMAWDGREAVRSATGGILEIRDGSSAVLQLPLTRDDLANGHMFYGPQSEKMDVRLKLLRGQQTVSESALYLVINPERSAATRILASTPVAIPEPVLIEPATPEIARPLNQLEEPAPPAQETREKTAPVPKARKIVREFHPPSESSSISNGIAMPARLPEVPDIHSGQQALPVAVASASAIGLRPPPLFVARQSPAAVPPQPRSGRLIWTGDLRKNSLLALSSSGASAGVLNGRLPGFPVKVTVEPAELVGGGIAIFSTDSTKSGVTEEPSASNGWNVVVYRWDPKRALVLNVAEAPSATNGWRKLVIGTGNHGVSVLVVDWQIDDSQ